MALLKLPAMAVVRASRWQSANRILLAGAAMVVLPVGCGAGFNPPPAPLAGRSAAEQARLTLGHGIHQARCAACHPFVNPADYSPEQLRTEVMPEMGPKAGLTEEQRQAVLEYLLAVRRNQ